MYSPTRYDAATFAAAGNNADGTYDWKQLAAIIGTGVIVGSYAMESQRRKKAAMNYYSGIETDR